MRTLGPVPNCPLDIRNREVSLYTYALLVYHATENDELTIELTNGLVVKSSALKCSISFLLLNVQT